MSYVRASGDQIVKYPYSFAALRGDHPDVSFPQDPPAALLAEYGVFEVAPSEQPAYDPAKNIVEGTPVRLAGVWTQVWVQEDATAEQIAKRTEDAAQATELSAAKLDAWIIQFLAMTPSGAQDFVNNNSATLAALRTNVARLAYAVRVLVRRELNV